MRRLALLLVAAHFLAPTSALAQQRLFVRMAREVVELDPRPAAMGAVVRRFALPPQASGPTPEGVVFGGGEFLVWIAGYQLAALNTQTGAVQLFAVPGFYPAKILGTDGVARVAVFGELFENGAGQRTVLLADARSGQLRLVNAGGPSFTKPIAYAPDADLVFVARPRSVLPDSFHDVDVIDGRTGALLKTLDLSPVSADVLVTNAAGTRLFVTDALNGTFAFDVGSGAQTAANTTHPGLQSSLRVPSLDESRNRLTVSIEPSLTGFGDAIGISSFSADTLQLLGTVQVPELPLPPPSSTTAPGLTQEIDVSGQSATLFVLQAAAIGHRNGSSTCEASQLMALDASTGQLRHATSTTDTLGGGACIADLMRATEPAAPQLGTAHVAGHTVTLQWQPSAGATSYEVEAGSPPGLANLAVLPVGDARLVVDAVPSGVYYVRVRARNAIGRSVASGELQVVVP